MFKIVPCKSKNFYAVYDSGVLVFSGSREQCESWSARETHKLRANEEPSALRRAFA